MQLEYILGHVSVGVAILDSNDFSIRYVNAYLRSLLDRSYQDVVGQQVSDVVPPTLLNVVLPLLRHVADTGQRIQHGEISYEGFLETRGRTYWHVSIERLPANDKEQARATAVSEAPTLCVTIEDVTETVRARLHLNAIHHISAVIAGPTALPQVLDRILQAIHEMVGATRCAVMLADTTNNEELSQTSSEPARTARIAAYKGIHPRSQDWRPPINNQILLGRTGEAGHALIITDTSKVHDINFPFLDDAGVARRPGSVLCVPIFEPYHDGTAEERQGVDHFRRPVLGTIEVYHRRTRGYPAEEVKLLERFAQQAGLAIHNARLFRSVDRWARTANRHARQKENMMQAIPDGVVIYDPRWRVADANHAARQLFGWTDDILGKPITQAMAESTSTILADFMSIPEIITEFEHRAIEGQIDEFKIVSEEGQMTTISCTYTPVLDDLGDIFAFIIVYHDVTEEVAARERIEAQVIARTAELAQRNRALQQAKAAQELTNARLELLLERLPLGVILVTAQNNAITIINHHAVQLLQHVGVSLEPEDDLEEACRRCIGMNCERLFREIPIYGTSGAFMSYEERPLYCALHKGEANEAELHTTTQDRQVIHLLVNAAPLLAADRTITSAVLVMYDVTAMKTLERAREDFFTTMAHELKTPLANIRAHLSALLARDLQWSGEEQYDFLQTADGQVERLVGMVNHFLDASRVEAGALRLELEPILLPEMLEDLQDRLEALITSSSRQLKITLAEQVPALLGDYELIMSVLTNLLSNAFRYAPEGDIVHLGTEIIYDKSNKQPTAVTLSVTDRGPGMTQEQQMEIFTRFSTFAAMSRPAIDRPGQPALEKRKGSARWSPATGLGLYISRGIIEAHGSRLTLKSSPGHGATFAFTLPIYTDKGNKKEKKIQVER